MSIQDDKEIYEYDKLFKCTCNTHYLRVTKFVFEPLVYFQNYSCNDLRPSFFKRIKLAINYIFNPKVYDIHETLLLEESDIKKLGRDLIKISQPTNSNLITGNK